MIEEVGRGRQGVHFFFFGFVVSRLSLVFFRGGKSRAPRSRLSPALTDRHGASSFGAAAPRAAASDAASARRGMPGFEPDAIVDATRLNNYIDAPFLVAGLLAVRLRRHVHHLEPGGIRDAGAAVRTRGGPACLRRALCERRRRGGGADDDDKNIVDDERRVRVRSFGFFFAPLFSRLRALLLAYLLSRELVENDAVSEGPIWRPMRDSWTQKTGEPQRAPI